MTLHGYCKLVRHVFFVVFVCVMWVRAATRSGVRRMQARWVPSRRCIVVVRADFLCRCVAGADGVRVGGCAARRPRPQHGTRTPAPLERGVRECAAMAMSALRPPLPALDVPQASVRPLATIAAPSDVRGAGRFWLRVRCRHRSDYRRGCKHRAARCEAWSSFVLKWDALGQFWGGV